jgi:hypothetical protein
MSIRPGRIAYLSLFLKFLSSSFLQSIDVVFFKQAKGSGKTADPRQNT